MTIHTKAILCDGLARLSVCTSFTALIIFAFSWGARTFDLGLISVAMLLPSILFTLWSGAIMRTLSPRRAFLLATVLRAAVLFVAPLTQGHLLWLAGCAGVMGLMQHVAATAKLTFDATITVAAERARFNAKRALLSSIAIVVGPSLAGLVGGHVHPSSGLILAGIAAIAALPFLMMVKDPARTDALSAPEPRAKAPSVRTTLQWLLSAKELPILFITYCVVLSILEMEAPLVFPFVREVYRAGVDVSGSLLGICGLGSLLGAGLMHWHGKPLHSIVLLVLLIGDGALLRLITEGPALLIAYGLFVGLGFIAAATLITVETQVQNQAPAAHHPLLFSAMAFVGNTGGAALTLLSTALADRWGAAPVLAQCAWAEMLLGGLGLILLTLLGIRQRCRTRA